MKTIIAKYVDNKKVIFTDTSLFISKPIGRNNPFENGNDINKWIIHCFGDVYSNFSLHFHQVDFDENDRIKGFVCSFDVPEYVDILKCYT